MDVPRVPINSSTEYLCKVYEFVREIFTLKNYKD
jgi:hypothetical protein